MQLSKFTISMLFCRNTVHMILDNDQFGLLVGAIQPGWEEGSQSMTALYEALMAQCTRDGKEVVLVPQNIFARFKALARQVKKKNGQLPKVMEEAFNIQPFGFRTGEYALEARQRWLLKNTSIKVEKDPDEESDG